MAEFSACPRSSTIERAGLLEEDTPLEFDATPRSYVASGW